MRTDSIPGNTDTSRWKLTHINYVGYDTLTGLPDPFAKNFSDSIEYLTATRQMLIIRDGSDYLKLTYSADSLLMSVNWFQNNSWTQESFNFNRPAANALQSVNYTYPWRTGTGVFKSAVAGLGKKIQYIDTLLPGPNNEVEFYTVILDGAGRPLSKKYEKDALGKYYSDIAAPLGQHFYTYDATGGLAGIVWIGDSSAVFYDTTKATYIRDIQGNNILWNHSKNYYGKDLSFWFSKWESFFDADLNYGNNSLDGGEMSSFYSFGKPLLKLRIEHISYYADTFSGPVVRHTEVQESSYTNTYDSNGNLSSYTETINGKISEKWNFRYKRL